ncbi:MAG TPA: LysE family transporter [Negativicutes bacterium]|nr:LysE family transporter [Negativicutes bacterium]
MIFKGFKFGMMLQLAIGPVCMFIFSEGCNKGFWSAEAGVLAVTLVDAVFILLAVMGITSFINNEKVKRVFKIAGALIVAYFGAMILISAFSIPEVLGADSQGGSFYKGFVMTASNPMTILFWSGVFSAKIAEESMNKRQVQLFGIGAVISTFLFMTLVALAGSMTQEFISYSVIRVLNAAVGCVLIIFAASKLMHKPGN